MATRADGTLPRAGKPATDAAKEAHAILVQAERGLTDSLAKPKVSNAKSLTGAFRSVTLRDGTDPAVARSGGWAMTARAVRASSAASRASRR